MPYGMDEQMLLRVAFEYLSRFELDVVQSGLYYLRLISSILPQKPVLNDRLRSSVNETS